MITGVQIVLCSHHCKSVCFPFIQMRAGVCRRNDKGHLLIKTRNEFLGDVEATLISLLNCTRRRGTAQSNNVIKPDGEWTMRTFARHVEIASLIKFEARQRTTI